MTIQESVALPLDLDCPLNGPAIKKNCGFPIGIRQKIVLRELKPKTNKEKKLNFIKRRNGRKNMNHLGGGGVPGP